MSDVVIEVARPTWAMELRKRKGAMICRGRFRCNLSNATKVAYLVVYDEAHKLSDPFPYVVVSWTVLDVGLLRVVTNSIYRVATWDSMPSAQM